jgi:hypothetical protein
MGLTKQRLLSIDWDEMWDSNGSTNTALYGDITVYKKDGFTITITDFTEILLNLQDNDRYKLLSMIYEYKLRNEHLVFCNDDEINRMQGIRQGKCTLKTIHELIDEFPRDINDIQDRILLNLEQIAKRYGDIIIPELNYYYYSKSWEEANYFLKKLYNNEYVWINGCSADSIYVEKPQVRIEEKGWIRIGELHKSQNPH